LSIIQICSFINTGLLIFYGKEGKGKLDTSVHYSEITFNLWQVSQADNQIKGKSSNCYHYCESFMNFPYLGNFEQYVKKFSNNYVCTSSRVLAAAMLARDYATYQHTYCSAAYFNKLIIFYYIHSLFTYASRYLSVF